MDVEVAYKLQIPIQRSGGVLLGGPQFQPLNLQVKIWGPGRSRVWLSVDKFFHREGCQWYVCDEEGFGGEGKTEEQ